MDRTERRNRLARRHFLAAPGPDVVAVADGMVGLHATDPASVFLAARARLSNFRQGDLEAALYDDRTLIRMLAMRRTVFVAGRDLAATMHNAVTMPMTGGFRDQLARAVASEAGDADPGAWLDDLCDRTEAALAASEPALARQLAERLPELATKIAYQQGTFGLSTRILALLAARGRIVRGRPRGSFKSSLYEWSTTRSWLGAEFPEQPIEEARAELIRRWLRSFGPASLTDAAWWTGWPKGITRTALDAAGAVEIDTEDGVLLVLGDDLAPDPPAPPWVALLPALDPTVMGWKERAWYLDTDMAGHLFDRSGNAGPTIWSDGRVIGGWAQRADGRVVTEVLEDVGQERTTRIAERAASLEEWLGELRIVPRFHTPLERRLGGG